jgi:hypothetical protein
MTANQIRKALLKNGVVFTEGDFDKGGNVEISRDEIEVCAGYYERNGYGNCNEERTENMANLICEVLGFSYAYSTGYGGQVLRKQKDLLAEYRTGGLEDPMHY